MKIRALTDIGGRKENQDNFWSALLEVDGDEMGVLCVCDGMGGLEEGGRASSLLVESIKDYVLKRGSIRNIEDDILSCVNNEIKVKIGNRSGTTCVILMCYRGVYTIVNVGDSRCYKWVTGGNPVQLTEDHTVIQKYGDELSESAAKKYKNVLTRCVGAAKSVKADTFVGNYEEGDNFLVCSDGFWHSLDDRYFTSGEIFKLPDMVDIFKKSGELDNITACILSI